MGSRVRVSSGPPNISSLERELFLYPKVSALVGDNPADNAQNPGLTGFDSKDNGYVSMQAHASAALKTDAEQ